MYPDEGDLRVLGPDEEGELDLPYQRTWTLSQHLLNLGQGIFFVYNPEMKNSKFNKTAPYLHK